MELRLLHGVAFSEPWFGRWGYKFGRGSFGVTQPMHQKAIETIQGMPLCILVHYLGNSNHHIPVILSRYQTVSDHSLVTLGDLFRFMLELKTHLPEENCVDSHIVKPTCRWSPKRVEMATRVIVEALKRAEFRWVSRQDVRDAARAYIGDTGLLDFVLKSLGNHVVGNYLVRRCLNPVTKVLEYCLEDVSNVHPEQQGLVINNSKMKGRYRMTRPQLMKDMLYLYRCILKDQKPTMNQGILSAIPAATRIILDTKYLVKEYNGELPWKIHHTGHEEAGKMTLYCTVFLRDKQESNEVMKKAMPPLECITLKNNATFNELKLEVERKFRELYWGLKSFVVESIMNLNVKGTDLVSEEVEVGQKIVLEGSNAESGTINELIYECGVNNRVVDCACGAKEDDGERMISCDICEVWQHSRCVQIPNNQEMPPIFLCSRCEKEIMILPSMP